MGIDKPAFPQVRFEILGPSAVSAAGHRLVINAPRQRVVLAKLLIEINQVVSVEALIDAIWGDSPPPTARSQVQICVSLLRRQINGLLTMTNSPAADRLSSTKDPAEPRSPISTEPTGYRIQHDQCSVDAHIFQNAVTEATARASEGDTSSARSIMVQALQLWRGPAFGGVDSEIIRVSAVRLEEDRFTAIETLTDWELALGQHERVIGELKERVGLHPFRERSRGQLMLALHQAGRQVEALEIYRAGWTILDAELGLVPGQELRALHARILSDNSGVAEDNNAVETSGMAGQHVRPVPRPDVAHDTPSPPENQDLVARPELVETLRKAVTSVPGRIVQATGLPGVGKSMVADRLAKVLVDQFPDGVLYADLRTTNPVDVLRKFLDVLGLRWPAPGSDPRITLREATRGQRVLVLLDHADECSATVDLLPASGGSTTVLFGRSPLRLRNYTPVHIDPLTDGQALRLLTGSSDAAQKAEPAARAVVAAVGALPAALAILRKRLRTEHNLVVAALVTRLTRAVLLDELAAAGLDMRSALSRSYRALSGTARWLFRLLSDSDSQDVPLWAAAAVSGMDERQVRVPLLELAERGLVTRHTAGYRVHPIAAAFGHERLIAENPDWAGTFGWVT